MLGCTIDVGKAMNLETNLDTTKMFAWTHHNGTSVSTPPTSHMDHVMCPTYSKAITDTLTMSKISGYFSGSPSGSLGDSRVNGQVFAVRSISQVHFEGLHFNLLYCTISTTSSVTGHDGK